MEVTRLAIDLAKNLFELCGADARGKVTLRRQLRRAQVTGFMRNLPACEVGMEACGGAHYWARQFEAMGHRVRLMSPALVAPYRKGIKTDRNDAAAILEALSRPSMRFVAVKSVAQQDTLALHRLRALLLKQHTALGNHLRGLLRERGVVVRQGVAALKRALPAIIAEEGDKVSGEIRELVQEMSELMRNLEQRLMRCEERVMRKFQDDERCRRLEKVPGVGPLIATATVATVGNAREFANGRQMSAFFGLTPGQHSSGGKTVMRGITKHGDRYLRTLLIHGARAVLRYCEKKRDQRSRWLAALVRRRGRNVAAVALANHNARVMWALLTKGENYRSPLAPLPGALTAVAD